MDKFEEKTMKALVYDPKTRIFTYESVPEPQLTDPHHVLVKTAYAPVCIYDTSIAAGEMPTFVDQRIILGHQITGIVKKFGCKAIGVRIGQRVTISAMNGCKECRHCLSGRTHFCAVLLQPAIGFTVNGGWSEFVLCYDHQILEINADIPLETAVFLPHLRNVMHCWDCISPVDYTFEILISGAGMFGKLWAAILHCHGIRNVTIAEIDPVRLKSMDKLGTNFKLVTPQQLDEMKEDDSNFSFAIIIETTGYKWSILQGYKLLGKGGVFCLSGISSVDTEIEVDPFEIYEKELKILGSSRAMNPYPETVRMFQTIRERYFTFEKMDAKKYPLRMFNEAFAELKCGAIGQIVFDFEADGWSNEEILKTPQFM